MAHFHTTTRGLLNSTGIVGDIIYLTEDETFWLVIANPMRRVPVASLFSGVHQCGRDGGRGEQGASGPVGPAGASGRDGVDGKDGAQGERGAQGDRGDAGHSPNVPEIVAAVIDELARTKDVAALANDARTAMIEETRARAREMARHLREL